MRCLGCGGRRAQDDPACRCGHPNNPEALAGLVRKFGVAGATMTRDHQHDMTELDEQIERINKLGLPESDRAFLKAVIEQYRSEMIRHSRDTTPGTQSTDL